MRQALRARRRTGSGTRGGHASRQPRRVPSGPYEGPRAALDVLRGGDRLLRAPRHRRDGAAGIAGLEPDRARRVRPYRAGARRRGAASRSISKPVGDIAFIAAAFAAAAPARRAWQPRKASPREPSSSPQPATAASAGCHARAFAAAAQPATSPEAQRGRRATCWSSSTQIAGVRGDSDYAGSLARDDPNLRSPSATAKLAARLASTGSSRVDPRCEHTPLPAADAQLAEAAGATRPSRQRCTTMRPNAGGEFGQRSRARLRPARPGPLPRGARQARRGGAAPRGARALRVDGLQAGARGDGRAAGEERGRRGIGTVNWTPRVTVPDETVLHELRTNVVDAWACVRRSGRDTRSFVVVLDVRTCGPASRPGTPRAPRSSRRRRASGSSARGAPPPRRRSASRGRPRAPSPSCRRSPAVARIRRSRSFASVASVQTRSARPSYSAPMCVAEVVHALRHRAGEAVDRRRLAEERLDLGGVGRGDRPASSGPRRRCSFSDARTPSAR